MNSKQLSMLSENSFIHPMATRWANATTLAIILTSVCMYMSLPAPTEIEYGNGKVFEAGSRLMKSVAKADQPPASQPIPLAESSTAPTNGSIKTSATLRKPTVESKRETEPNKVVLASPDDQPLPKISLIKTPVELSTPQQNPMLQQLPTQPAEALEPHAQFDSQIASEPKSWIVAGETAPHYALESMELSKKLVTEHGGRFLVTDRNIAFDIGRTLSVRASDKICVVDQAWHERYANRMVALTGPESDRAISMVRRLFPQLEANAGVYLSVPHSVDREIYAAQRRSLGESWDVSLVTVMGLRGRTFEVLGISP